MSLYTCNGCNETIPAHKARVHCDICVGDYNSCANCYVVGKTTSAHDVDHENQLMIESGFEPKSPPIPPRQQVASPPPLTRSTRTVSTVEEQDHWWNDQIATRDTERQAAQSTVQPAAESTPQPATTSGWTTFFTGSSPTSLYTAFLTAIFRKLDTDNDGLITPEEYTSFLEVQQYAPEEHPWKKFHKDLPGYTAADAADFELRTSYENWGIPHENRPRPNAKTANLDSFYDALPMAQSMKTLLKASQTPKSFTNGLMPMLTLQGFVDITVIETLIDPNPGWLRMNRVAGFYRVWVHQWGEIPREVMPQLPPRDLVAKVALVTRQSAARREARISDAAAGAAIAAQGREHAIRLLDPPGTRYYYRD